MYTKKVFSGSISAHASGSENSCYVYFPASNYELLDAADILQKRTDEAIEFSLDDPGRFRFLEDVLPATLTLSEINLLARELYNMDDVHAMAFEGLIQMERLKGCSEFTAVQLASLAYNSDCCHVLPGTFADEDLGRFYAEEGFLPELEDLPESIFELLDFTKIGKCERIAECGVFTSSGYVTQDTEFKTFEKKPMAVTAPDYIMRIELVDDNPENRKHSWTIDLPVPDSELRNLSQAISAESTEDVRISNYDGILSGGNINLDLYHMSGLSSLNEFARKLEVIKSNHEIKKFKALVEATSCYEIEDCLWLADHMDEFYFDESVRSPIQAAESVIKRSFPDKNMCNFINLSAFGNSLFDETTRLTPYGVIKSSNNTPIKHFLYSRPGSSTYN